MTVQPVILLTFSNSKDDYLPMIVEEQKSIKKALLDFADKNYLQLRDIEHASTEEVFYLINRYNQRVAILHYGGHANDQSIQLESEVGVIQTANVKGIAGLLGTQKQLKLVFLNGCASRGQVKVLLDHGVPVVIATRVAIMDKQAQLFASQFYESLAAGCSIREAFQIASSLIETGPGVSKIMRREEAMGMLTNENEEEEIPWGLYAKKEDEAALDWKIPSESLMELKLTQDITSGKQKNTINSFLVFETIKSIANGKYAKVLYKTIMDEVETRGTKRSPTDAELKGVIMRSFLSPISVHLRILFTTNLSEKYDEVRLRQLWTTYHETLRLFAFILLSDLWDTRLKLEKPLVMAEAEQLQLKAFFEINRYTSANFDYFLLIDALLKVVNENEMSCYMPELNTYPDGWVCSEILSSANEHFQTMRLVLEVDVPSRLIEAYCILSEQQLTRVLIELRFMINYKMAVVKNIEVKSIKNMPPTTFPHNLVVLDNDYGEQGKKDRPEELNQPTAMESVLLYRELVSDSLNLSPFVLDQNALTREINSKIYVFSHTSDEGLHYYWNENITDTMLISDTHYPTVKRQFEKARQDILNEKQHMASRSEIPEDESIISILSK